MPSEPSAAHRCSVTVFDNRCGMWQCARNASVERDGKSYCWQHDPERVAAEKAKSKKRWDAEFEADTAKHQWRPDAEQFLKDFLLWLAVGSPAGEVSRELSARARQLLGKERADAE